MVESEKAARQRKEDSEAKRRARSGRRSGSGAGSSSGGSRERSRRHDDADREAKRRAKRSSGGGEEVKPGAACEKTSSRSMGSRSSSRRSNRDEEDRAAKQRARSGGSRSSRPGVETVAAGDSTEARIRRKQSREDSSRRPRSGASSSRRSSDEKASERRSSRASRPGAAPATSSSDRSRAKSGGRNNSQISVNGAANEAPVQVNENGEAVVAATLIEEEKEDEGSAIKERERARIREIERKRLQKEAEKERLEQEEAERQEKEKELEEKKKKKKRNMIIFVILVLLVIGGGVAAFFALQGNSSSDSVNQATNKEEGTPSPSVDSSTSPTLSPSGDPSSAPTNVPLKYNLPSDLECERIAAGLPIDGENEMFDQSFAIPMEVDILDGNGVDSLVPDIETKIEKLLVPDLIGCPRGLFNKRRLGLHHRQNHASAMSNVSDHSRQLQNVNIRYAIAKAIVTVTVTDDACQKSGSLDNCSVVTATLDLKVRGDENIALLAEVIQQVFPNGKDIRPDLELIAPFDTIVIGIMRSLDPTQSPTIAPTGTGSQSPSSLPSGGPSTNPTDIATSAPVVPTKAPTKAPSKSPTKAPTPPPTLAPTPTPPPTVAPQPGLTLEPTPPPTKSPTKVPTKSPTKSPTKAPTMNPTESFAPTPAPTSGPTNAPTLISNGNPCSSGNQCESGICDLIGQSYMCVECTSNGDCTTSSVGPRCNRDTSPTATTPSLCAALASYGESCTDNFDCALGRCSYVGGNYMCVECTSDGDCVSSSVGPRCDFDTSPTATDPWLCAPLASNGEDCFTDGNCASNKCEYFGGSNYMCVECQDYSDCDSSPAGPLCERGTYPGTPSVCAPKYANGVDCDTDVNCASNKCEYFGGSNYMCVECDDYSDCDSSPAGPLCERGTYPGTPSVCAPKYANGVDCYTNINCASNKCEYFGGSNYMCVECDDYSDCDSNPNGTRCARGTYPGNPSVCAPKLGIGESCYTDINCASNNCDWGICGA